MGRAFVLAGPQYSGDYGCAWSCHHVHVYPAIAYHLLTSQQDVKVRGGV